MRDIKFRAWVQGFDAPFHAPESDWSISLHDTGHKLLMWCSDGIVDELTVSSIEQFTGLKDKNGVDIYEGDIVKWDDQSNGDYWRVAVVKLNPDIQFICFDCPTIKNSTAHGHTFKFGAFIYTDTHNHLTVTGNIHQNPELLEVSA